MLHRLINLGLAGILCLLSANAVAGEECSYWFPDFGCERDARYDGFVAPMSAPFLFEDPFITTGISAWAIWHDLPERSLFNGGDARAVALQFRVAVTDRLAFVASKDGRISIHGDQALLSTARGYGDLGVGFKYALIDRPDQRFILTPSLRYEWTQGSRITFGGNGEGVWIPAVSTGWATGDLHFLADLGARLPLDGDEESTPIFYNLHVDYAIREGLAPFVEINGLHYVDDGTGVAMHKLSTGARLSLAAVQAAVGTGAFEGNDLFNLGSNGVKGNDIVSLAVGTRFALSNRLSLGVAYELPISARKDLLKQRVSMNLLFEL